MKSFSLGSLSYALLAWMSSPYFVHGSSSSDSGSSSSEETPVFGADELEDLRDEIRELMLDNEVGNIAGSPRIDPEDTLFKFEIPLIASSVRLAFHDCAGEFPTRCNGCLDFTDRGNGGLFEGSADPLSTICNNYKTTYGLSIADCWSLAAIFGLELSGELTQNDWEEINTLYNGNLDTTDLGGDIPSIGFKPGDIPYYIGRIDCDTAPNVADDVIEQFPRPPDSWEVTQHYFGDRFPTLTKKEIVALIAGGHSLGRSSGATAGPWDVSPNTFDNEYSKALLGENRLPLNIPFNWEFGRFKPGPGPPQFFVDGGFTQFSDSNGEPFPIDQAFLMLEADISLAYDLSFFTANRLPADCMTQAVSYCNDNFPGTTVLEAGESQDNYPVGTTFCPEVQCPLQCVGGDTELDSYVNNDFNNLDDNYSGCPVAWITQFADDEDDFTEAFISGYTKMITAGYTISDCDSSDSSDSSSDDGCETDPNVDYLREIVIDFDSSSSSSSD